MGEAGVRSGHVVQPPQPRACPPPPVRRGLGRRGLEAGARGPAGRRQELSASPSAEVGADVPGSRRPCQGQRGPWRSW